MIKIFFNDFIDYKWWVCIFNKVRSNFFYVIMKRVQIVSNFKRLFKQKFN